jgi:hypothetical protein
MAILASDDFAGLGTNSPNGRSLNHALGGTGAFTWATVGSFAGISGGVAGSSDTSRLMASVASAKTIRVRVDPLSVTENVLLYGLGASTSPADAIALFLGENQTSLRVSSFVSGARTDHVTLGITAPGIPFFVELEYSGLVVTARVLNADTSVRNTTSHTFASLPSSGSFWGVSNYFGGFTSVFDDVSFTDGAVVADTTAPILTSATGTQTGSTTASGSVTTDEANGTLYYVTTANASETGTTVKAGASQAVTATGAQSVSRTGLTAATTYRHHFLHRDAAGNDSAVLSSATFTTAAAPKVATVTLTTDGTTPAASLTGLRWAWWDAAPPNLATAPIVSGTAATTNASGVMTVTLTGTALAVAATGTLLVLTSNGTAGSTANRHYCAPVVVS